MIAISSKTPVPRERRAITAPEAVVTIAEIWNHVARFLSRRRRSSRQLTNHHWA